jgi:hypothetical protein
MLKAFVILAGLVWAGIGAYAVVAEQSAPASIPVREQSAATPAFRTQPPGAALPNNPGIMPIFPSKTISRFQPGALVGPDTLYVRGEWQTVPTPQTQTVAVHRVPGFNAWRSATPITIMGYRDSIDLGFWQVGRIEHPVPGANQVEWPRSARLFPAPNPRSPS